MKKIEELKRDIKNDPEVKKYFINVKDEKDAAKIAKSLGYEVSEAELRNDEELNEDMLEAVAGGKGDTKIRRDFVFVAENDKYKSVDIDNNTGKVIDYKYKK